MNGGVGGFGEGGGEKNKTDGRFFWLAVYVQPGLWVALAVVAVVRLKFTWLSLVGRISFSYFLSIAPILHLYHT